ncbi:MAG: type II secretion system protein G [Acidobacteriota bacterium]|nr:type II secretion system protein G [Acidobacteriota bacterium]
MNAARRNALILLALSVCVSCKQAEVRHDVDVKQQLATMRAAIERFHKDNGRYPHTLSELVPKYLRAIPVDPVTGSASTWRVTTEETVTPNVDFTSRESAKPESVVIDVRSGGPAPYSTY